MQIKGILFDKDGTLIDFQSLWLQAAKEVADLLIRINGLEKSKEKRIFILKAMGAQIYNNQDAIHIRYKAPAFQEK